MTRALLALVLAAVGTSAFAQAPVPAPASPSSGYGIVDNSFLLEEAFNQEPGVVQNIFGLQRARHEWVASFTQEWPAPGMRHQLSYTVPFGAAGDGTGIGDVLVNYRFQAMTEAPGRPAFSPRVSVILPTAGATTGLGGGTTAVQVGLPFSKRTGDFYLHLNVGFTFFPAHVPMGDTRQQSSLLDGMIGASIIRRLSPTFNVFLEAILASTEEPSMAGSVRSRDVTLSPGFRTAVNLGEKQFVWGLAAPMIISGDATEAAVFVYLSYELPFKK